MRGLPITVERRQPAPDLPNEVTLAPFTTDQLGEFIPYAADDPALEFLSPWGREFFTKTDLADVAGYYHDEGIISWGVHHRNRLIGTTALTPIAVGASAEIFFAPGYRGRGFGELVAAGLLRATFTPQLLFCQNPNFGNTRLYVAAIDAHRRNLPSVNLARRFGFRHRSSYQLPDTDGFRFNTYQLYGGIFPERQADKWHKGTLQAHGVLQGYQVMSEGEVPISDQPDEIVRPFTFTEREGQ